MRYSQRYGYKPLPSSGFEDINPCLKNAIWKRIYKLIDDNISSGPTGGGGRFFKPEIAESLWTDFFHRNINENALS